MPTIIKDQVIIASPFVTLSLDDANRDTANCLLPMAYYIEHHEALQGRQDIGIWVAAGEAVEDIAAFVHQLAVIALDFPHFGDGRGYSSATILRRQLGYQGEIRAIGDVRRDQLEQMQRCGINAYELADGQDIQSSAAGLAGFSFNYQASIDSPTPLFRQR
ncbi:MAG: DUF934 domain-containing protein [SAR86 cluster bacterium]|jgi:uncharacterized protein (DUF934 family)|tara:strand:- start:5788 stop:6270 length:483 start_codon:yes stop_codon:yes gene_type:complete